MRHTRLNLPAGATQHKVEGLGFGTEEMDMAYLAPPEPPRRATVADDDNLRRLNFRMWQVLMTTITVLLTVWFITIGPVAAVLALVVAKHVLVAILIMGLDLYPRYKGEQAQSPAPPPGH